MHIEAKNLELVTQHDVPGQYWHFDASQDLFMCSDIKKESVTRVFKGDFLDQLSEAIPNLDKPLEPITMKLISFWKERKHGNN